MSLAERDCRSVEPTELEKRLAAIEAQLKRIERLLGMKPLKVKK